MYGLCDFCGLLKGIKKKKKKLLQVFQLCCFDEIARLSLDESGII